MFVPPDTGTGGYAVVKLGTHVQTGREVAVKIMRLPGAHSGLDGHNPQQSSSAGASAGGVESAEEDVFKEIEILKSLDQCVAQLLRACAHVDSACSAHTALPRPPQPLGAQDVRVFHRCVRRAQRRRAEEGTRARACLRTRPLAVNAPSHPELQAAQGTRCIL